MLGIVWDSSEDEQKCRITTIAAYQAAPTATTLVNSFLLVCLFVPALQTIPSANLVPRLFHLGQKMKETGREVAQVWPVAVSYPVSHSFCGVMAAVVSTERFALTCTATLSRRLCGHVCVSVLGWEPSSSVQWTADTLFLVISALRKFHHYRHPSRTQALSLEWKKTRKPGQNKGTRQTTQLSRSGHISKTGVGFRESWLSLRGAPTN